MKRNHQPGITHFVAICIVAISCLLFACCVAVAQIGGSTATHNAELKTKVVQQTKGRVSALLVSDIHFEPFWDPSKVQQLISLPVGDWKRVLAAPPSTDQAQRFAELQKSCHTRGSDTSYSLFESSLKAMQTHSADAKFMAVSGDLIAHAFSCKYDVLYPHSTPSDYRAFVEKTINYVIGELRDAVPGVPVYVALGNNDSDCGDYQLDAHGEFLSATSIGVTKDFPASERQRAMDSFAEGGFYSVSLPGPIQHTRLVVLNDLFMSKKYTTCAGKTDLTAANAQLAWLQQQIDAARAHHEKVWVMGHIPPGIDLHSTVKQLDDVCGGQGPEMFLSSEKLADELADSQDVIQLAIFAHTHMDEMRILQPEKTDQSAALRKGTAVKMVGSISPIDGNNPSFTVAYIDPTSAALMDYQVFTASNQTGIDTKWAEEYDFARSYHKETYTSSSISELLAGFASDPDSKTEASQSYIKNFSVGYLSPVLKAFWPQYVCSLSNGTAKTYRACVCPSAK